MYFLLENYIGDAIPLIQQRIQALQRRVRFRKIITPIRGMTMNKAKLTIVQVLASW